MRTAASSKDVSSYSPSPAADSAESGFSSNHAATSRRMADNVGRFWLEEQSCSALTDRVGNEHQESESPGLA